MNDEIRIHDTLQSTSFAKSFATSSCQVITPRHRPWILGAKNIHNMHFVRDESGCRCTACYPNFRWINSLYKRDLPWHILLQDHSIHGFIVPTNTSDTTLSRKPNAIRQVCNFSGIFCRRFARHCVSVELRQQRSRKSL